VEIAEEVKATHRTMTHERRNQKGQRYNLDHFEDGNNKVYFYRPPSVLEVEKRTRKAKHIDHYVGPATIVKRIGNRSFQISFFDPSTGTTQLIQRDVGMIILKKEWIALSSDPLQIGSSDETPTSNQVAGWRDSNKDGFP
jgi:hypothetical protein